MKPCLARVSRTRYAFRSAFGQWPELGRLRTVCFRAETFQSGRLPNVPMAVEEVANDKLFAQIARHD